MSVTDEYLANNAAYAKAFTGPLPLPPSKHVAVVACMDARMNVYGILGLNEGEAHVIRNAGGRASGDAIRSLVISHKLLGTREWFVIHHTNCGMELFTDEIMGDLLAGSLATAKFDGKLWSNPQSGGGDHGGHFVKWHTIRKQEESVVHDVARIRSHPLVPANVPIYGYVYDVKSGKLIEVPEATAAGRAA